MKKQILVFSLMISLVLTACGTMEKTSTEATDIIAEHTASLLLKYDRGYKEKLADPAYLEQPQVETEIETDKNKPIDNTEEVKIEDQDKQPQTSSDENIESTYKDFSKLTDIENITIKYEKYGLYDNYPQDQEDDYFALEKNEGSKLCVIEFSITNDISEKKNINLVKSGIVYGLEINSVTYNPLLTLLENDLQLLNTDIKGNSVEIGYLVFEVPEDVKVESGQLYATKGSLRSNVELQ